MYILPSDGLHQLHLCSVFSTTGPRTCVAIPVHFFYTYPIPKLQKNILFVLIIILILQDFVFFVSASILPVLRSRNYLFSAPAPNLTIISDPAPAPTTAIYWHLKLFLNTSTIQIKVEITFSSS